jgi:hemerythrin
MWKDSYLIDNEIIDTQHKELFIAVESLRDNLGKADLPNYKKQLIETAMFLKGYALDHFRDEEEYQRKIGFDGYVEHKKKHDRLVDDVLHYEKELVESDFAVSVVKKFLGFLATWLIYHVGGEDQQIPKGKQAAPARIDDKDLVHVFAAIVENVLKVLSGFSEQNIQHTIGSSRRLNSGVSYKVGFIGAPDNRGIGFIYTDDFAFGMVKAMTGMKLAALNEVIFAVLQEISNIASANIAALLSKNTNINVDIETPEQVRINKIPQILNSILVHTAMGDMEVVLY